MSLAAREIRIGKNCVRGLEYGPMGADRAILETEGTVFPNADRPQSWPAKKDVFLLRDCCERA